MKIFLALFLFLAPSLLHAQGMMMRNGAPAAGGAPLAFDNSATGSGTNSDSTTTTVSLAVSSNSNRWVGACIWAGDQGSTVTISGSPTFAGSSMNLVNSGGQSGRILSLYQLAGVPAGSNNFSVTFTGTTWRSVVVFSFYNVNQASPVGTSDVHNCPGCTAWADSPPGDNTVTVGTNGQSIDCQGWADPPGTITCTGCSFVNSTNDSDLLTPINVQRKTATGSVTFAESWVNSTSGRHLAIPINSN